jgi:molecular chaperone DnaK
VKNMVLLDVTPLSLGLETLGGVCTVLIERNTTVPVKKSEVFSTAADQQPSVEVVVLQGERKMAKDNRSLARFNLDGIPSAPRGVPQIEVTFDIDVNGVLSVGAKDKATGKEQTVTITNSSTLGDDDIERMVNEAAAHADEDEALRKRVELRNQLDSQIYQVGKTLEENSAKLSEEVAGNVAKEIDNAKAVLDMDDSDTLEAANNALMTAAGKMAEELYSQAEGAAPAEEGGDENVVDAEFTDASENET